MQPPRAAILMVLCTTSLLQAAAGHCVELTPHMGSAAARLDLQHPHLCRGLEVAAWKALPALWGPIEVVINCTTSEYTVVTLDPEKLGTKANGTSQLVRPFNWCGSQRLAEEQGVCRVLLSPLRTTVVALQPSNTGGLFSKGGPAQLSCEVTSTTKLSWLHVALTAAGVLLYFGAPSMSMSATFRLIVVVLMAMLTRPVPYAQLLVAANMPSSTSMLASMLDLLLGQSLAVIVVALELLGLAGEFYISPDWHTRLKVATKAMLQLLGLLLVYLGVPDQRMGAPLLGLMTGSDVLAERVRMAVTAAWMLGRVLLQQLRSTWFYRAVSEVVSQ